MTRGEQPKNMKNEYKKCFDIQVRGPQKREAPGIQVRGLQKREPDLPNGWSGPVQESLKTTNLWLSCHKRNAR